MIKLSKLFYMIPIVLCIQCTSEDHAADTVIINADLYTVAEGDLDVDAVAMKDGLITWIGKTADAPTDESTKIIDAEKKFVMPGFIEGHGHYSGLGSSIQNLNFLVDTSWQQITEKIKQKVATAEKGEWIYGRGWHQEKFSISPENTLDKYPTHETISELTPDNPVMLIHASGHSLFANKKAMETAGISKETPDPSGGKIIRDKNKEAIGVFEERAMTPIRSAYNDYYEKEPLANRKKTWKEAIKLAEQDCLQKGITSFQDAGSSFQELEWYEEMAENGELDIRLWVMVRHSSEELKGRLADCKVVDAGNGYYSCVAVKSELDGALGAHGAWLIEDYEDKPGFFGQNTTEVTEVEKIAEMAYANGMQLCVHAIGDQANRKTLDIFEDYKNKDKSRDLRWRVEHAQHLHPDDIGRFSEIGAIASMQGVHCTSDAPFVETRLGEERASEGAYAWRSLLDAGAVVINGTDAPVEDVNPLASIYASVTRKRDKPEMEFMPHQRMTREEAVYSYTMAPAFGGFEEDKKGSIEIGKYADFVILDQNIVTCPEENIEKIKVLKTIVGGEIKYEK